MTIVLRLAGAFIVLCMLTSICGVIGIADARSPFQKISAAKVDAADKAKAEKAATDTLTNWKEGKFEPRSDDYSEAMKEASTPARQKAAHQDIKAAFGDIKSLKYVEAVASKNLPNLVVYRFKGTFTGTSERPEIRVVIDPEGKIAGLWIKPWKDELQ